MNDLETELRAVARALVADAPPPPPFATLAGTTSASMPRRPDRRVAVVAAVLVLVLVGAAGAAILLGRDDPARVVASVRDEAGQPTAAPHRCDGDPALRVTVPDARRGATDGPAPGNPPLAAGQRAIHWSTAEGFVELRWPGRTQSIYDDGASVISTLVASESVSAGRSEIDVHPAPNATDPATTFDPDVIVERDAASPSPTAPCDLLELTVATNDGRWHAGLRPLPFDGELRQPAERVDLQPRIIERRAVDVAPRAAISCQGSDQHGTPPNRAGGADRSISGDTPADVLLGYLAANPGAPPSGYIEMAEPDGSITYAVDPSGIGWTTLVFAARGGDVWYLEGWMASGC